MTLTSVFFLVGLIAFLGSVVFGSILLIIKVLGR